MAMENNAHLEVLSFAPDSIQIQINDIEEWKNQEDDKKIHIGSIILINDRNQRNLCAIVESFQVSEDSNQGDGSRIIVQARPIGQLEEVFDDSTVEQKRVYQRGIRNISIPPQGVRIAEEADLSAMLSHSPKDKVTFSFGKYLGDREVPVFLDGNKFFSKHSAILGSTGSGKSCTVATILQQVKKSGKNIVLNNSHIILFDVHGEYNNAFDGCRNLSTEFDDNDENYLAIPYWLLTSNELEEIFIDNSELGAYNQISQFKIAVVQNKRKWNSELSNIDYDTPVYFSINEVLVYLQNMNEMTHYTADDNEIYFADRDDLKHPFSNEDYDYLFKPHNYYRKSSGKQKPLDKKIDATLNGYYGSFVRFVNRFQAKLRDPRLHFLLKEPSREAINQDGQKAFFRKAVDRYFGYGSDSGSNITTIDLSALPFEVVSIIVSVISRMAFDMCYYQTRLEGTNSTPLLMVYEEAHRYIPKKDQAKYRSSREAVERIAKEGRKYGISEMIVSQRPSEISDTVLSQCSNFVVMKLSNKDDRNIVKSVLPDTDSYFTGTLSSLDKREAVVTGDAFVNTCVIQVDESRPVPHSQDVKVYTEWSNEWKEMLFEDAAAALMRIKD